MKQRLITSKTGKNTVNKYIQQAHLRQGTRIGSIRGYVSGYISAGLRYGRLVAGYISRYAQGIANNAHLRVGASHVGWPWLRSGMAN